MTGVQALVLYDKPPSLWAACVSLSDCFPVFAGKSLELSCHTYKDISRSHKAVRSGLDPIEHKSSKAFVVDVLHDVVNASSWPRSIV